VALTGLEGRAGLEGVVGFSPKERPARNQDTFPTSSNPERAIAGASGENAAPVKEAMTVTERLRRETVTRQSELSGCRRRTRYRRRPPKTWCATTAAASPSLPTAVMPVLSATPGTVRAQYR
jgi:hypothetical protein